MKNFYLLITFFFTLSGFSQIVINEIDADTPGTDVKEFVEIKSSTANFSLNGYVLVFFNGGDSKSYLAFDLDQITTNINGIATLGNSAVSPVCNRTIGNNIIQNGPDAVALYLGNGADFPTGTNATTTNLIHAMAYGSNDPNATNLMAALGITIQYNEAQNGAVATQSIQRKADGTFETKNPTPGINNDGTGTTLNTISTTVSPIGNLLEGNTFSITFTTQTAVTAALNFSISLINNTFLNNDFTGDLNVSIPIGATSTTKNFSLIDDILTEGDEEMMVSIGTIPSNYVLATNNILVRVNDTDNAVQVWGSPLSPTYGLCANTAPAGYYASLEGKSGAVLKQAIQDIIANPNVVREYTYGDVYDILKNSDQNPNNSSQVWMMYVEQPRSKLDLQTGSSGAVGFWNREHIYPQSRGGFSDGTSSFSGNINTWLPTDANDVLAGHSDAHHIRAEDSPENSLRSNRNYGVDYNGRANTLGSWKGDVARAVFYMCVRYNGLNVVNGNPPETPDGFIGDLATLLQWNMTDTADDFEMNRNNIIYTWQQNRNPFIDYPTLANYVFGNQVGQTWFAALSNKKYEIDAVQIFPNPAHDVVEFSGINEAFAVMIFNVNGQLVFEQETVLEYKIQLNLPVGIYVLKVESENGQTTKKLILK